MLVKRFPRLGQHGALASSPATMMAMRKHDSFAKREDGTLRVVGGVAGETPALHGRELAPPVTSGGGSGGGQGRW